MNLWFRKWFDFNKKWYIDRLSKAILEKKEKEVEDILWNFAKQIKDSVVGKARRTGIDFAIRKYGLKQNMNKKGKENE